MRAPGFPLVSPDEKLDEGSGTWRKVLARVDEAPEQHRAVCEELRKLETQGVLPGLGEEKPGSSAENEGKERELAADLGNAADLPHAEAIERVLALEEAHRRWRSTRWAKLGEAPLAKLLEPLARLATGVRYPISGADVPALGQAYADDAHKVDLALLGALAVAGPHLSLISKIARALYWPWADALAARFRDALTAGGPAAQPKPISVPPGTCLLFVDGLRTDPWETVRGAIGPLRDRELRVASRTHSHRDRDGETSRHPRSGCNRRGRAH